MAAQEPLSSSRYAGSAIANSAVRIHSHFGALEFIRSYEKASQPAIEFGPSNDSAYVSRGTTHYEKAEFDRAIADFNKPLRSTQDQPLRIAIWA